MFRGTLKLNTLIATLQLVDRICDVAFCLTDDELKALSWTTFVSGCQAPELVQYLKERRLYVNDAVESQVMGRPRALVDAQLSVGVISDACGICTTSLSSDSQCKDQSVLLLCCQAMAVVNQSE